MCLMTSALLPVKVNGGGDGDGDGEVCYGEKKR